MLNKEIESIIQMTDIRTEVGRGIQVDQEYITEMLTRVDSIFSNDFESVREEIEDSITGLTESGLTQLKSRPHLSAHYVMGRAEMITNYAKELLVQGEHKGFVFFYDYAVGIYSAMAPIFGGELALRGAAEELSLIASEEIGKAYNHDISSKIESYLAYIRNFEEDKQLLIGDPTGFALIDETARFASGDDSGISEFQSVFWMGTNRQIVGAGAVYGAKLYKEVYGVLETLYS